MENNERNSIQIYFKEINDVYKANNNDYNIEYCPENRDKLIQMNLKTVIHIAKKYIGLGVVLEDLIGAGNVGLCLAWEKFDPSRNTLKKQVLDILKEKEDNIPFSEMDDIFALISYGALGKKFSEEFPQSPVYHKKELIDWVNKNVFSAKFNSIAAMWVRALILQEIDIHSRLVKKPKVMIYKDKLKTNSYQTETLTDLSGVEKNEDYISCENTIPEVTESYTTFRNNLNILLDDVCSRDRGILLKKFGIGLPRPMLPKEIADQEGLSIARISQIIQNTTEKMISNSRKFNIDSKQMYEDLKNMMF